VSSGDGSGSGRTANHPWPGRPVLTSIPKGVCQLVANVPAVGGYELPCLLSCGMAGLHRGCPINIGGIEDAKKGHEKWVVVRDRIQKYSERLVVPSN